MPSDPTLPQISPEIVIEAHLLQKSQVRVLSLASDLRQEWLKLQSSPDLSYPSSRSQEILLSLIDAVTIMDHLDPKTENLHES